MNTQHHPPSDGVDRADPDASIRMDDAPATPPPPITESLPRSIRRSKDDQVLGGVCGGLGASAGIDPLWFRLGFIFLALSSGVGVILYLIAWIAIPEATDSTPMPELSHTNNGAVVFGIFLLAIGSALLADAVIPWFDRVVWPLALIGVGVGMIYFNASRRYRS